MKILYLGILLIFISQPIIAQFNHQNDTSEPILRKRLANSQEGVDKIRIHLALGRAILYRAGAKLETIDSAMSLGTLAEAESRKISFTEGVINALVLKALCFNQKNKKDIGFKVAQQALALSKKVKNNNGVAESYIVMGQYYPFYNPNGLRIRTLYYNRATAIFRKEHNMRRLAAVLEDDAELCFLANKKTEAIKLLFEALNVNKVIGNKAVQGIYWMIARTSNGLNDYPDAVKYNLLAIKTAETVGDSTLKLCSIYHNMAVTYISMADFRQALPYSLKALQIARRYNNPDYITTVAFAAAGAYTRINKFAQALPLLQEMEGYAAEDHDKMIATACYLTNLNYDRQFNKAEVYAQKLIKQLAKFSPDDFNAFTVPYCFLANYYTDSRQINMAYYYANLYAATIPAGARTAVTNKSIENVYYRLDSIRGDFRSAFKHYRNAQRIKDSVDNLTKAYQISFLQIENDTERKSDAIDALNKQALVKDNILKRNRLIQEVTIAGCVMLVIITILIYSRYRLKQRSNALLVRQKSEIDQQNVALKHLVDDKNRLIGDKDMLLQDKDVLLKDKDLLIKEVNHRVKNNLQIVMSLLQSQSGYLQNKHAQEAILEGQNRVQSIALIHDQLFRTDSATEIDLVSYIAELVYSLNYSLNKRGDKVKIRFNVDAIMLDVSQAIPVGIILNETVTNALKYAFPANRAGEIRIVVKEIEENIMMQISDNGVGMPEGFDMIKADSLGMTLISGLASQLKGDFDIHTTAGVTIIITFPIEVANTARVAVGI